MSEALLFDIDELDSIDTLKPKIEVQEGDIWQLGRHKLLCGDCTIKDNISLLMDGKKVDMVFTDPPYGIGIVDKNGFVGGDRLLGQTKPYLLRHGNRISLLQCNYRTLAEIYK